MYHRMIMVELNGDLKRRNRNYFSERTSWTIAALKRDTMREEGANFGDLQNKFKKPTHPTWERSMWVSEETQRLENQRMSLKRRHLEDQREIWTATMCFQESLQEDRRWRVSTALTGIEYFVVEVQTREAWNKIHKWYQQSKRHPTPPSREGLERTSTLREDLYRERPP